MLWPNCRAACDEWNCVNASGATPDIWATVISTRRQHYNTTTWQHDNSKRTLRSSSRRQSLFFSWTQFLSFFWVFVSYDDTFWVLRLWFCWGTDYFDCTFLSKTLINLSNSFFCLVTTVFLAMSKWWKMLRIIFRIKKVNMQTKGARATCFNTFAKQIEAAKERKKECNERLYSKKPSSLSPSLSLSLSLPLSLFFSHSLKLQQKVQLRRWMQLLTVGTFCFFCFFADDHHLAFIA